jgi:glycosyltransferase involved in cell wall biosynthesis
MHVAFMSSFVPRECGLATFTEDLLTAASSHGMDCRVLAMNRPGQAPAYDARVVRTIQEDRLSDYLAAAQFVNRGGFDVLSVQHEYGIFGGVDCDHLSTFLEAVNIPVVTTLHTVVRNPSPAMRRSLSAVARRSAAIMVMNSLALDTLEEVYGVDRCKVSTIHHGAPPPPRERLQTIKADMKLQGRKVISTFGLLSPNKGLEYAVRAMPRIVAAHPDAVYLILGQTHPVVKGQHGERYRDSLKALARELGIAGHVSFVDKYFTKAELVAYLLASDIYLTPYLDMEQVTSGTLAYAMCCGRALVSTPYLYAQFLIGEDRGLLVPPKDAGEIADACLRILGSPVLKAQIERQNWRYGQTMVWPRVGREFLRLCRSLVSAPATATTRAYAEVKR